MRKLSIQAPADAAVYLDGRPVGSGPRELSVSRQGHRLRVEKKGHRVYFTHLAAGRSAVTVTATLVGQPADAFEDIRRLLGKLRQSSNRYDPALLGQVAKRLFLDYLLVCSLEGKRLRARWFSRRLGRFSGPELGLALPLASGQLGQLGQAFGALGHEELKLAQRLAAPPPRREPPRRRVAKDGPTSPPTKKKKATPLWKKWYFWVAAAVIVGVVAGFAIKDSLTKDEIILRITRP